MEAEEAGTRTNAVVGAMAGAAEEVMADNLEVEAGTDAMSGTDAAAGMAVDGKTVVVEAAVTTETTTEAAPTPVPNTIAAPLLLPRSRTAPAPPLVRLGTHPLSGVLLNLLRLGAGTGSGSESLAGEMRLLRPVGCQLPSPAV